MDLDHVMAALVAMRVKNPGKQMQYTDVDTARTYIAYAIKRGVTRVVDGYFIMFDIGRPWYSATEFLLEELLIRIYPTSQPVEVAIDALSSIAKSHGLQAVVAGDTQIGYMAPKYLANGFVTLGTQLMKEIHNGLAKEGDGRASTD